MEKFFVILGIFMLLAVLFVNRVIFQISDTMNIILCVFAALFMIVGITMKDLRA